MIIVFDKPTALNPTGSSSPDYVPLIPPRARASHLFPFTLPRPSHGGQSPAGLRFLASMSNAGSQPLHLGFVQLGNLLEAERTIILPPPRCVCRCFPGWWHLWKTCLYLHLVGCWWKAEHGGLWCPGGVSVPGGLWPGPLCRGLSKGRAALRKGTVCREGLRRNFISARLLSDSREMLLAELWGAWLLAHRSRRCWTGRTGCVGVWWAPCTACGHISTAWHSSGGMEWCPELGEGWMWCPLQLQSREVPAPQEGDGMDTDNCSLQTAVWGRYSSARTCYLGWRKNYQ